MDQIIRAAALPLLALLSIACSQPLPETPVGPRYPALTGRVVDEAGLLSPQQEKALDSASARLEREVGPQLVVATVTDLQGYSIEEYGVGLGRHWGIGHEGKDDGLLLIVAPRERKVRIEVGYGLEKRVSDQFAKKVIEEQLVPLLRQGRYPEAIETGSSALMERLRSGKVDRYGWERRAA